MGTKNAVMPLTKAQAEKATKWLMSNFGNAIEKAVIGTPFNAKIICAIACQETAYRWLGWVDRLSPNDILKYCIFDATGDTPDTVGNRKAFPKNRNEFLKQYPQSTLDLLVSESNKMRRIMGWSNKDFLYKGYGIFQYDLQFIKNDRDFFVLKQWYSMDECLKRLMKELNSKYAITKDIYKTIRAYNGSGVAAENYAKNVSQFIEWC